MEILSCLDEAEIISHYEILDIKEFEDGFYMKIAISLINGTELCGRDRSKFCVSLV